MYLPHYPYWLEAMISIDLFRFLVGEPRYVQAVAGNIVQEVPIED